MNRNQRRQAQRDSNRGISRQERIVPLPALLDEFTVFDMPQSIIDQLVNGAIDTADDVPVFRDNSGQWCEVLPALEGWLYTWRKINAELNLSLSFYYLTLMANRLAKGEMLHQRHIEHGAKELFDCRIAFRSADRKSIVSIAKTAQFQILLGTGND
jgi:hypothetical protein